MNSKKSKDAFEKWFMNHPKYTGLFQKIYWKGGHPFEKNSNGDYTMCPTCDAYAGWLGALE